MAAAKNVIDFTGAGGNDDLLFSTIAEGIMNTGYSIIPTALPAWLTDTLFTHQQLMEASKFKNAGVGRGKQYLKNEFVRTDAISWITGETKAGKAWLSWVADLQVYLNRRLFLGLFSFESHFAHYSPGDYYKRHYDAFKGESNRVLSLIVYFNSNWLASDGGELVLYQDQYDQTGIKVVPLMGTIVAFLSEEFPHEVLAANRDRYSIAGWFRLNTSMTDRVDPPR
ncbi:2OG-Fe(II) oxygenase [Psychromonas aquatilis]